MLPRDSSCSSGTSRYCVIKVNFKLGGEKKVVSNPREEVLFF